MYSLLYLFTCLPFPVSLALPAAELSSWIIFPQTDGVSGITCEDMLASNFSVLVYLKMSLALCFWRSSSLDSKFIRFQLAFFSPSVLKIIIPMSSCMHNFWWKVSHYHRSLVGTMLFSHGFYPHFLFTLVFSSSTIMWLGAIFLDLPGFEN